MPDAASLLLFRIAEDAPFFWGAFMTKLMLGMMCVGMLAGCTSSTMPAPSDPATAIHEEPVMSSGKPAANPSSLAASPQAHGANLAESATASK